MLALAVSLKFENIRNSVAAAVVGPPSGVGLTQPGVAGAGGGGQTA